MRKIYVSDIGNDKNDGLTGKQRIVRSSSYPHGARDKNKTNGSGPKRGAADPRDPLQDGTKREPLQITGDRTVVAACTAKDTRSDRHRVCNSGHW